MPDPRPVMVDNAMLAILKALYLAAGAGVAAYLVMVVVESKRRLDRRVAEFREEQEANQGPPPNPYQALAELYAEDERKNQEAQVRRDRK